MTDPTQLTRAVANTLWWYLQRAAWVDILETRAISPTGNPRSHNYAGGGHIPSPEPTIEVLSRTPTIRTNLWSDDWPGGEAWRILLTRPNADQALSLLPAAAIADYQLALEHATCRKPFTVETDEHGQRTLTRNRHEPALTHLAAEALQAVARAADLNLIPAEIEDALLTDSDISLDAIRAARFRVEPDEPEDDST